VRVALTYRSACSACLVLMLGCDGALVTLGQAPTSGGSTDAGASSTGGFGGAGQGGDNGAQPGGRGGEAGTTGEGGAGGSVPNAGAAGTLRFDEPRIVEGLSSAAKEENPTFTSDLLRVYFSTTREDGDSNVWSASRSNADAAFDDLERVEAVTTTETETSPAIAADGLTLWVGREADGDSDFDVWRVTRATLDSEWSDPEPVPELNSEYDDIPRPTSLQSTVMPLGSRRDGKYLTYFAVRESPSQPFGAPELIDELVFEDDRNTIDAFLSSDGRMLFFSASAEEDKSDLYVAMRKPGDALEFEAPTPLAALNTVAYDERDPFLSEDGSRFFFVSNRSGDYEIFEVAVLRD